MIAYANGSGGTAMSYDFDSLASVNPLNATSAHTPVTRCAASFGSSGSEIFSTVGNTTLIMALGCLNQIATNVITSFTGASSSDMQDMLVGAVNWSTNHVLGTTTTVENQFSASSVSFETLTSNTPVAAEMSYSGTLKAYSGTSILSFEIFDDATLTVESSMDNAYSNSEGSTELRRFSLLPAALADLSEFAEDNWDGEGAAAVSGEAVDEARRILCAVPPRILEPEVAPAADGSVCMEWDAPRGSIWLDIAPDRSAQTLVKIGSFKVGRHFQPDAPDLPGYLCSLVGLLYPEQPDWASRTLRATA